MKYAGKIFKKHNAAQDDSKIRPKKSLGQNFLKDEPVLQKIIDAAELKPENHVVEIGPGQGVLTERLAEKVKKVTAIELDDRLIVELKIKFLLSKGTKVEIIHGDALKINPPKGNYKVVANIPYYITSPLIRHFLLPSNSESKQPEIMVLLIQQEVAEKIVDSKKESVISLFIKLFGKASIVDRVKAAAFEPKPKVDSAILKIENIQSPNVENIHSLLEFIKMGFHSPRKKIHNNLSKGLSLPSEKIKELLKALSIDPDLRPEKIKLEEWIRLSKKLKIMI